MPTEEVKLVVVELKTDSSGEEMKSIVNLPNPKLVLFVVENPNSAHTTVI